MATVELSQSVQQIDQLLPILVNIVPFIIGITLAQAAKMKANVLGNNLSNTDRGDLRAQAIGAQNALRNAYTLGEGVTAEMIEQAGLATVVLTMLAAAERRREEKKEKHR